MIAFDIAEQILSVCLSNCMALYDSCRSEGSALATTIAKVISLPSVLSSCRRKDHSYSLFFFNVRPQRTEIMNSNSQQRSIATVQFIVWDVLWWFSSIFMSSRDLSTSFQWELMGLIPKTYGSNINETLHHSRSGNTCHLQSVTYTNTNFVSLTKHSIKFSTPIPWLTGGEKQGQEMGQCLWSSQCLLL